MESKSKKPAADRLTAPNAAADSPSRRAPVVQSEASSMQNESAAASSPPPEIAPWLALLTPESFKAFKAELPTDSEESWLAIAERIGLEDAVLEDEINPTFEALAIALLQSGRAHQLSRKHPLETMSVAGMAMLIIEAESPALVHRVFEDFYAPELAAAIMWLYDNRTAEFHQTFGVGNLIN